MRLVAAALWDCAPRGRVSVRVEEGGGSLMAVFAVLLLGLLLLGHLLPQSLGIFAALVLWCLPKDAARDLRRRDCLCCGPQGRGSIGGRVARTCRARLGDDLVCVVAVLVIPVLEVVRAMAWAGRHPGPPLGQRRHVIVVHIVIADAQVAAAADHLLELGQTEREVVGYACAAAVEVHVMVGRRVELDAWPQAGMVAARARNLGSHVKVRHVVRLDRPAVHRGQRPVLLLLLLMMLMLLMLMLHGNAGWRSICRSGSSSAMLGLLRGKLQRQAIRLASRASAPLALLLLQKLLEEGGARCGKDKVRKGGEEHGGGIDCT
jgi:hypothetical protein